LARRGPDLRVRNAVAGAEHAVSLLASGGGGHLGYRLRQRLGGSRDLLHDLDDVTVRVEDAELTVGAVPAGEDVANPLELAVGAQSARVRLDLAQRPPYEVRDRKAVAPPGGEIHHGRLEPVPARQPLVLADQDAVVRRNLLPGVVPLAEQLDE